MDRDRGPTWMVAEGTLFSVEKRPWTEHGFSPVRAFDAVFRKGAYATTHQSQYSDHKYKWRRHEEGNRDSSFPCNWLNRPVNRTEPKAPGWKSQEEREKNAGYNLSREMMPSINAVIDRASSGNI